MTAPAMMPIFFQFMILYDRFAPARGAIFASGLPAEVRCTLRYVESRQKVRAPKAGGTWYSHAAER